MKTTLLLEIKGNSLDDGPGIRSVVFYKGCPLSCLWCHNPESKSREAEISHDPGECVACGACREACPENALSPDNPYFIDRDKCPLCFQCTEVCPSGALSRVGREMSVDAVMARVMKDKPFYDASGGGVTLSGGEPTLHMDHLEKLLAALKAQGVHTLLETCGLFDFEAFRTRILPHLDMIYMDLKIMDPAAHREYCGASNHVILENFKKLHALHLDGRLRLLPRTPLVPGITDGEDNVRAIAAFLNECRAVHAQLLPYHPLWQGKNRKIGVHDPRGDREDMQAFLPQERLKACQKILEEAGISPPP